MTDRSHAGVSDPFNVDARFDYFWNTLVPDLLNVSVDPIEDGLTAEQRAAAIEVERAFAVDFVECSLPHRADLSEVWLEHLGFTP